MATAVLPHAQLPREVHLHRLPPATAEAFADILARADWHADRRELSASALLHAQAIQLIGIRPPASGELAKCTCEKCYCETVFDANKARCYISLGCEFVQCETCADEHRIESD